MRFGGQLKSLFLKKNQGAGFSIVNKCDYRHRLKNGSLSGPTSLLPIAKTTSYAEGKGLEFGSANSWEGGRCLLTARRNCASDRRLLAETRPCMNRWLTQDARLAIRLTWNSRCLSENKSQNSIGLAIPGCEIMTRSISTRWPSLSLATRAL